MKRESERDRNINWQRGRVNLCGNKDEVCGLACLDRVTDCLNSVSDGVSRNIDSCGQREITLSFSGCIAIVIPPILVCVCVCVQITIRLSFI